MTFKSNWEKISFTHQLLEDVIDRMVQLAYSNKKLISHELISGGCANLNYKIQLENEPHPLILRIYLHNKNAPHIEQKLANLLKALIPIPLTYYVGELDGYHFAITEFMPGISLRDLLLSDDSYNLELIMSEVSVMLTKILSHQFPIAGFFNEKLDVIPNERFDIIKVTQNYLSDKTLLTVLDSEIISKIRRVIEQYGYLSPKENENYLVHGDFDPSNILVDKIDGTWIVSGILDWEFAFSGSYLWDIANMLRYAHKMPNEFEDAFINGLTQNNIIFLDNDWKIEIKLLNLISLLDCLKRSDTQVQHNKCADISELITHILSELNHMNEKKIIEILPHNPEDNYDWLRAKSWPDYIDQNIINHLNVENKYYNDVMCDSKANENMLYEEMIGRISLADKSVPILHDEYYYSSYTNEDSKYPIYIRKHISGKNEIIFDPNIEAQDKKFYVVGNLSVNDDHQLLAYSFDELGNEIYTIKIRDLKTGKDLPDLLTDTIGEICWSGNSFYYLKLNNKWQSKKVYFHVLGENQADDKLIYFEESESFQVDIYKSADKNYIFINSSSSNSSEIRFICKNDCSLNLIYERRADILYYVNHHKEYFYIQINDHGKNNRIIKVKVENLNNCEQVVAYNPKIYIEDFNLYKKYMVLKIKESGLDKIKIYNYLSNDFKSVEFSEESYSAEIIYTDYQYDSVRFNYSALNTPNSIIEYEFETGKQNILKLKEIPSGFDPNLYQVKRVNAPSEDVLVPISLIYKKNQFNGKNPLYLYGYGSYGIHIDANFKTSIFSLIDRGFVYAIAHIRGGDDLGYEWYESAKFLNKKRTFTDFVNVANYLVEQNYTTHGNITISGGSAGGMLVGAVLNMNTKMFKAAIMHVPFVDVLNTMLDETLPLTSGEFLEWGNPKDEEYYQYIKSYSPYDNIQKINYPAIYITAGLYDPRVTYWEPAKYVAKLREYKTDNNLLLLETNMEQGHKGASDRFSYIKEIAKEYNFILKIYSLIK